MKIKLPKPVSRDPNALDAKSRKAAGAFRDKRPNYRAQMLQNDLDEIFADAFDALADMDFPDEQDV